MEIKMYYCKINVVQTSLLHSKFEVNVIHGIMYTQSRILSQCEHSITL